MSKIEDGGPAFPYIQGQQYCGMTLRDYAAIKLKVPDSGKKWLDDMILESLRNDLAAKAMEGNISSCSPGGTLNLPVAANWAHEASDAMLAARKGAEK